MDVDDIQVRDFSREDIPGFLEYWYDSDPAFLAGLGVNPARLPRRAKMQEMLVLNVERSTCAGSEPSALLAIALCGTTVGVHELTHLKPRPRSHGVRQGSGYASGIMHAHIWKPECRGKGIAIVSYVRAMHAYFSRFGLDAILFETPAHNRHANRIKDKLGISASGEARIYWPLIDEPLPTAQYRVTPMQMPQVEQHMRRAWQERMHRADGAEMLTSLVSSNIL